MVDVLRHIQIYLPLLMCCGRQGITLSLKDDGESVTCDANPSNVIAMLTCITPKYIFLIFKHRDVKKVKVVFI